MWSLTIFGVFQIFGALGLYLQKHLNAKSSAIPLSIYSRDGRAETFKRHDFENYEFWTLPLKRYKIDFNFLHQEFSKEP